MFNVWNLSHLQNRLSVGYLRAQVLKSEKNKRQRYKQGTELNQTDILPITLEIINVHEDIEMDFFKTPRESKHCRLSR